MRRYLIKCLLALQVGFEHIYVTVSLTRGQESIGDHNGVNAGEDLVGNHGDAVGPLEGTREHLALEIGELHLSLECVPDVGNHGDLARGEGAELGDQEELW